MFALSSGSFSARFTVVAAMAGLNVKRQEGIDTYGRHGSILSRSDLEEVDLEVGDNEGEGDYSLLSEEEEGAEEIGGSSGAARRPKSPLLEPSEVEEILEHSEIVPAGGQLNNRQSGADLDGSSQCSSTDGDSSDTMTESREEPRVERRRSSLMDGIWACLAPVTTLLKNREKKEKKKEEEEEEEDDFEIAFADIKELEFIGSGAQGAVFCGEYRGEKVAVKKVKDLSYCDEIRQLRKLSHRNIIQFRYVSCCTILSP